MFFSGINYEPDTEFYVSQLKCVLDMKLSLVMPKERPTQCEEKKSTAKLSTKLPRNNSREQKNALHMKEKQMKQKFGRHVQQNYYYYFSYYFITTNNLILY